jgi:hypothetical protein
MRRLLIISIMTLVLMGIACGASNSSTQQALNQQRNAAEPVARKYPRLKMQADQLNEAVLKGDYAKAAELTYPKLIELMGGRMSFMSAMENGMRQTQSERFRIVSITVGEARDVLEVEKQIYAIVPTTMRMKVPEGILVGEAFMIAVSTDGGENWTFVDSGGRSFDKRQLMTLFPSAAERLRIPDIKRPVLEPK